MLDLYSYGLILFDKSTCLTLSKDRVFDIMVSNIKLGECSENIVFL